MTRQAKPNGKKAQSTSCLTKVVDSTAVKPNYAPKKVSALFQPKAEPRSSDAIDLVDGVVGLYTFPGGDLPSVHICVREVETSRGQTAVASITHIMHGHQLFGQKFDHEAYLICNWLLSPNFKPILKYEVAAATQQMIHSTLHPLYSAAMTQMSSSTPTPTTTLKLVGGTSMPSTTPKEMGAKEKAKLAIRRVNAVSEAFAKAEADRRHHYAAQCANVGLHYMRSQAITLVRSVSGCVGYVDMSDQTGNLMIRVTRNSDTVVKVMKMAVAYIDTSHTLWTQGVRVGDSIESGHLMSGDYGKIDVGVGGVRLERAVVRDALTNYIQSQLRTAKIYIGRRQVKPTIPASV